MFTCVPTLSQKFPTIFESKEIHNFNQCNVPPSYTVSVSGPRYFPFPLLLLCTMLHRPICRCKSIKKASNLILMGYVIK